MNSGCARALSITISCAAALFQSACLTAPASQAAELNAITPAAAQAAQAARSANAERKLIAVTASDSKNDKWWKHAVFYEIYPRSFADARDTGMGDIKGITSKLDYLKDLGIGAIWLTPCYPSPQVDFGYDISDYETIAPEYGTMADFDELVAEAKKRDIRIIMDLVLNHTSDKHAWFVDSRSSKTSAHRDWYIWRDPAAPGKPPNNWQACFGHSAWTMDPRTKQYYYHFFYPEQPDLNWRNPEVRKAMYDIARFWLKKGVAGFRLDAVGNIFEDPNLPDDPILPGKNRVGDPNQVTKFNENLPEVHDVMRELRAVTDEFPGDRVLVGENYGPDVAAISKFYGKNLDEVQLPMNFNFCEIGKLSAEDFRNQITPWDRNPAGGWPVYVLSNHDRIRHFDKFGDGKHNDEIAKLTAAVLLTLRGTPIMYYGEELGMQNRDPVSVDEVQDPIGKIGWPTEKGRDGERTPMQWTAEQNAGFSSKKTWLPIANNYKTHNVASENADPNSILNFYKQLTKLRTQEKALADGAYIPLNESDPDVLSYLRQEKESTILVAVNMSPNEKVAHFKLESYGVKGTKAAGLLSQPSGMQTASTDALKLAPYGVFIGRVK
jgi:alpha-glucosidase